jgi:hypothetical protein
MPLWKFHALTAPSTTICWTSSLSLCVPSSVVRNDCVAMEKFSKSKRAWLEKYLSLPHGIPYDGGGSSDRS